MEVGAELFDRSAQPAVGGDRWWWVGAGDSAAFQVSIGYIYKALGRRAPPATRGLAERNRQTLKLPDHHASIAAEVALRPDVTLDELRAWLLAAHGVTASLGLMHKTLARLGLTRKSRAGRRSRTDPMSPSSGPLARRATRVAPGAAGLRRRDRCRHQHGPPLRPLPARPTPGRPGASRPLEEHDLCRWPHQPRLPRPLRPRRPDERRRLPGLDRADVGTEAEAGRHRDHGQSSRPQDRRHPQAIEARQAELRYLPPYSPDLNPIEQASPSSKPSCARLPSAPSTACGMPSASSSTSSSRPSAPTTSPTPAIHAPRENALVQLKSSCSGVKRRTF